MTILIIFFIYYYSYYYYKSGGGVIDISLPSGGSKGQPGVSRAKPTTQRIGYYITTLAVSALFNYSKQTGSTSFAVNKFGYYEP